MKEIISERLRKLRSEAKISQRSLAEATGMHERAVRHYENAERESPRLDQLTALADYFGVSIDYLVGRTDDPHGGYSPPDP